MTSDNTAHIAAFIRADERLSFWLRCSMRYTSRQRDAARDFLSKLSHNNIAPPEGYTFTFAAILAAIRAEMEAE